MRDTFFKKSPLSGIIVVIAMLALVAGCSSPAPKTDTAPQVATNPMDTLKTYIEAKKMEMKAYPFIQSRAYDSALSQCNKCIAFLSAALTKSKNKGLCLYGDEIADIYTSMQAIYDSLHQPENAIKCTMGSLTWARRTHNYTLQINSDLNIAVRLKSMATGTNDTAKKGTIYREAVGYSIAAAGVIDSLRTNDMDDLRYTAFHVSAGIYLLLGDKKQAQLYYKKYKDTYFKIYKHMPEKPDDIVL